MDGLEVDEGFAVPEGFDVDPETCHCTTPPWPSNPKHPRASMGYSQTANRTRTARRALQRGADPQPVRGAQEQPPRRDLLHTHHARRQLPGAEATEAKLEHKRAVVNDDLDGRYTRRYLAFLARQD